MSKKPAKKIRRTPAPKGRAAAVPPPVVTPTLPVAAIVAPTPAAPVTKPRPVARFRRATASPAQARGTELIRYLRIHLKHPYGKRGQDAICRLAVEVAHLGRLELARREESAAVSTTTRSDAPR